MGSVISKFMDRIHGTESWLVYRRFFDPHSLTTYGELWGSGARVFALRSLIEARKYDIIHVHSLEKIVPFLKLIYSKKPVVLHITARARECGGWRRTGWLEDALFLLVHGGPVRNDFSSVEGDHVSLELDPLVCGGAAG